MMAKAVANATTASFISVVGSEFVQKYLGEVRVCACVCSLALSFPSSPPPPNTWSSLFLGGGRGVAGGVVLCGVVFDVMWVFVGPEFVQMYLGEVRAFRLCVRCDGYGRRPDVLYGGVGGWAGAA
jgi:hypothetical protein